MKIIAVDIGGTKMLLYSDVGGNVVEKRVPTGDEASPQSLCREIHSFIRSLDFVPDAVGVCVPGLVQDGVLIVASDRPNMVGLSEEMLSTPQTRAFLINDVRAAMYSQLPKYPRESSICVIVIGTGIGMSVYSNGVFLTGANGFIGEWGLCPVRLSDGTMTTYDAVMTGKAIVDRLGLEPLQITQKLEEEDPSAVTIVKEAGFYCGCCLASCINLFNPEYIVLTGSTTEYKYYRSTAMETCRTYSLPESFAACTIVAPSERGRIVLLGTVEYAREMMEEANCIVCLQKTLVHSRGYSCQLRTTVKYYPYEHAKPRCEQLLLCSFHRDSCFSRGCSSELCVLCPNG